MRYNHNQTELLMPSKTQSVLVGGLIAAVIGTVVSVVQQLSGASDPMNQNPILGMIFGLLGCMVMIASGVIAVWHYTSENELTIKPKQGVGIGVLAGLIYAVAAMVLAWLLVLVNVIPSPEETMEMLRESGAFDAPGAEQGAAIAEIMVTYGWIVFVLIGGVIMGLVGGAIGAALFKRGPDPESELLS